VSKECKGCGHPIPEKRLEAVPDAEYCVDCLEVKGDVFRYKGIRRPATASCKHFGEVKDIIRTEEGYNEFQRLKR
jgi:hypothetical protein